MRVISIRRSSPAVRVVLVHPAAGSATDSATGSAVRVEARLCSSFSASGLSGWDSGDMGGDLLTRMFSPAPAFVYQSGDPSALRRAPLSEPPTEPLWLLRSAF